LEHALDKALGLGVDAVVIAFGAATDGDDDGGDVVVGLNRMPLPFVSAMTPKRLDAWSGRLD